MAVIENICKVPEINKYFEETGNKLIVESCDINSSLVKLKIGNEEMVVHGNLLIQAIDNCRQITGYCRNSVRYSRANED